MGNRDVLLDVKNVSKTFAQRTGLFGGFGTPNGRVHAVDGVSFRVHTGETFGLVGESGCGKSTLSRALLRLIPIDCGEIVFEGKRLHEMEGEALRRQRREMRMVFQKPFASLNPRQTVREIIAAPMEVHEPCRGRAERGQRDKEVLRLMDVVGLPAAYADRHPHEFSGGQRQRIGIARAIAGSPKLIVCDEPVSALDVSIQAQVLNLLKELQKERRLTYLFISHNLSVVRHMSDRIAVMYLGSIVEIADAKTLYENAKHPYTRALLSAIPDRTTEQTERIILTGDIPSPVNPPPGCRFSTRCWLATARCGAERPPLRELGGGHSVACFLHERGAAE